MTKKLTVAKANRLVAVIAAIMECDDVPDGLVIALSDARAEIDPFTD